MNCVVKPCSNRSRKLKKLAKMYCGTRDVEYAADLCLCEPLFM